MAGARIVYNHFPKMAGAMRMTMGDIVHQTTENIADKAETTVRRRTGELADSKMTSYSDDGLHGIAGFTDFKAIWEEYGTGEPAPTRAVPYLTPASEEERGRFEAAGRSLEPRLRANLARATVTRSATGNVKIAGQGINAKPRRRRR
jgi:hypothetical protein